MNPQKFVLSCLMSVLITSLSAQSASEKRSYMKTLPAGRDTKLEVVNKHGNINITTWKKDSVFIMAEIEANAPSQGKLRNMFDGIKVNINDAGSFISAKTEFDPSISVILETFKGLTEKIIDYDSRVRISYFINIPEYLNTRIENQFGDITLENNIGSISVSLSNGDFKANSLNKLSDFSINFGEAEIGSVKSGKITSTFAELVINESEDLSINSTSSKFNLEKAGRLNFESRRDKVYAGDVDQLEGTSYFTDFKITNLVRTIDLTLKYGSLDIEKAGNRFENINMVSAYSDITIAFDPSASFGYEIRHTNAFVALQGKNNNTDKKVINEDKKEYLTTGTYGRNPGSRKVTIEATRGNINIK